MGLHCQRCLGLLFTKVDKPALSLSLTAALIACSYTDNNGPLERSLEMID